MVFHFQYNNVIDGITISRCSLVFSQSRVKVSASLADVGSLAVGAFDLENGSLSVAGFVSFTTNPDGTYQEFPIRRPTDQLLNNRPIFKYRLYNKPTI